MWTKWKLSQSFSYRKISGEGGLTILVICIEYSLYIQIFKDLALETLLLYLLNKQSAFIKYLSLYYPIKQLPLLLLPSPAVLGDPEQIPVIAW